MFQFPESRLSEAIYSLQDTWSLLQVGSPIRTSTDRCMLTANRRISLFAASFFASLCLASAIRSFLLYLFWCLLDYYFNYLLKSIHPFRFMFFSDVNS